MSLRPQAVAPRCRGMTLLELLIAMAVFALLSVMAYGGLRAVLDADEATAEQARMLGQLQRAIVLISGDLEQLVDRPVRGSYGDSQPALDAGQSNRLEWTRAGWRNPAGHLRSNLQRVAYEVEEGSLVRSVWHVLDRAQDSQAEKGVLLDGVLALRYRVLDSDREWHNNWPPERDDASVIPLPLAVELMLETERWGVLTRLILLSGGGT